MVCIQYINGSFLNTDFVNPAATQTLIFKPFPLCSINIVGDGESVAILGTGNGVSAWITRRECQNDISPPSAALWHSGNKRSLYVCLSQLRGWNRMVIILWLRGNTERVRESV